ncbi:MAG: hypothetical protein R2728_06690 [Chitinophagales bacterium]
MISKKVLVLSMFSFRLIIIFFISLLSFSFLGKAQNSDYPLSAIPEEIVSLRINLILLRNDNGEGGFNEDNPEHLHVLQSAVNWMNGSLEHNAPIRDPNCYGTNNCYPKKSGSDYQYIKDTKIRFQIGEIFSFNKTEYWDNWDCQDFQDNKENPECPPTGLQYRCPNDEYEGNWYLNPLSQKINRDSTILPAINIFFTEDGQEYVPFVVNKDCSSPSGRFHIQDCSERPEKSLDKEQRVHMRSQFLKYTRLMNCMVCKDAFEGDCQYQGTPNECCSKRKMTDNIIDGLSRALMHELGHTLDFSAGHCNVCPGEGLMHASNPGKSLHSTEIVNAHQNIQNTDLIKYAISDQPIYIRSENQTWTRFLNLHKDYIVTNAKQLTLKNETHILNNNSIQVENGSLVIESNAQVNLEEDASLTIEKGSALTIKSGAVLNIKQGASINIKCGGKLTIEDGVMLNRGAALSKAFQFNCSELEGPKMIQKEAIFTLPYNIPESYVSWSIFPEGKVEYAIRGNSITVFPIENAQGNVLIKANLKAPYKELWSSKIAWVGDDLSSEKFIGIVKGIFYFQINQAKKHTGF